MMGGQLDNTMHSLDLRNSIRPLALLTARKTMRDMAPGETLEVVVGDPETRTDFFKVLSDISYELLRLEAREGDNRFYRIRIRKKETVNSSASYRQNSLHPKTV
jgi:TusA-related sulfurtransferase